MEDITQTDVALTKAVSGLVAAAETVSKAGERAAGPQVITPRRGLSKKEAAAYVGVSPTTFDTMVKSKSMPNPVSIGARKVWDVRALDAAFDALATPDESNPWDNWG